MSKKRKSTNIPNRKHADRARSKPAAAGPKRNHPKQQKQNKQANQTQQHERPTIPFTPHERILLIGEGDLSFATSLVQHHGCTSVTATVLEKNKEELEEKYPHVAENIEIFMAKEDASSKGGEEPKEEDNEDAEEEEEEDKDDEGDWSDNDNSDDDEKKTKAPPPPPRNNRIAYNIDATKPLPNNLLHAGPFSTIMFNFPHVGGLSTDVNRQVRHNQSLLVSFFTSILNPSSAKYPALAPKGSIVITLFEAEPYTLWNVKDLARHAGLAVERSFKFQAEAYPGYKHARTCGVIEGKGGAWKGEERKARSYVFRRKDVVEEKQPQAQAGKKRKKEKDEDEDEEDDD
jgi:25S rRNA (uracil2634-N3)-methyltransferase